MYLYLMYIIHNLYISTVSHCLHYVLFTAMVPLILKSICCKNDAIRQKKTSPQSSRDVNNIDKTSPQNE